MTKLTKIWKKMNDRQMINLVKIVIGFFLIGTILLLPKLCKADHGAEMRLSYKQEVIASVSIHEGFYMEDNIAQCRKLRLLLQSAIWQSINKLPSRPYHLYKDYTITCSPEGMESIKL